MLSPQPLCQAEWSRKLRTGGVKKLLLVVPPRQLQILDKTPHLSTPTHPLSALGYLDSQGTDGQGTDGKGTEPQVCWSKMYHNGTFKDVQNK